MVKVQELWWEEMKTTVWQIEVEGCYVARRQDNNQINGTKLLNITKITRGKRDGILKNEKLRSVVKVGTISLKGVWIPFERALSLSKQYKIYESLYPLFENNINDYVENTLIPTTSTSSVKRKSLNNLMDSLTTNQTLQTKRRSTVSSHPYHIPFHHHHNHHNHHNHHSHSYQGHSIRRSSNTSSPNNFFDTFGLYPSSNNFSHQNSQPQIINRPRNSSSASDWISSWSTSSSSPIIPATPINAPFSPLVGTLNNLTVNSPPTFHPSPFYYDSTSSYFPPSSNATEQSQKYYQNNNNNHDNNVNDEYAPR